MKFVLLPILDIMIELYQQPLSPKRFQNYLATLKGGTKDDMTLPIAGFNPMAKPHVLQQLLELKTLGIESIIAKELEQLNVGNADLFPDKKISVSFCLCDDLKGGWTNKHTTDFDSKFKINAFVARDMCVPYFWTSEVVTAAIIKHRVREYCYRTIYWQEKKRPQTLGQMVAQELFVQEKANAVHSSPIKDSSINDFVERHNESDNVALLLNFWYGDKAVEALGYKSMGINRIGWPKLI